MCISIECSCGEYFNWAEYVTLYHSEDYTPREAICPWCEKAVKLCIHLELVGDVEATIDMPTVR